MANPGIAATIKNWQSQPRFRRPLKWFAWFLAVMLVLAAVSWLTLPSFVKKIAIEQTQEKIGRKIDIGAVAFNPFRLALTVSDVTLYEPDQKTPFFSAKSLVVNASSTSLFRLAPVLDEIKLTAPDLHVVRLDADGIGHYNFSDILERIDAMPKSDSKTQFSLANVQLQDGKIRFEDKVTGKDIDIKALQIGLPFISNLSGNIDSFVQPHLAADINGTPFRLQGRSKPFASSQESNFAIDIDKLDVVSYLPFVPAQLPVILQSAKLSTKLDLNFVRAGDQPKVALSGELALEDVSVQDKSQGQLFKARKLAANIKQFDVLNASGEIAQVSLEAPQVWAAMNAHGEINWVRALASGKPAKAAKASSAAATPAPAPATAEKKDAVILVQQFSVRDGEINWRDEANASPAQNVQLGQLSVDAEQISTAADAKPAALKISLVENGHGKLAFDGAIAPLKPQLNGKLTLEGIDIAGYQNYLNRSLAANVSGSLSGASTIQFQDQQLKLGDTGLDLANLKLTPKTKSPNAITVKSIALQNASLDMAAHQAQADAIRISGLAGDIRREDDGSFNVQKLQAATPAAPAATAPAPEAVGKAAARGAPAPQWVARLNSFSLADSSINFEDTSAGPKSRLKIQGINLQVQNLSSKLDQNTKLSLQAQFDKSGKLDINGQAAPQLKNINLNLDAKNLPIAPFQGYFSNVLNVALTSGLLSAKGKLAVTPPLEQQKFALSYNGSAALANLRMQDKVTATDFLRWRALDITGIQAKLGERANISLDKIALSNFYARAILSDKGRLNLQDILVADAKSQGSITNADKQDGKDQKGQASVTEQKTTTSSAPVTAAAPAPNAPVIRIGQVVLAAGNINYTDNFVKPNYTANMTDLAGTIGEISSEKPQPAPVNISGKIDNDAPLQISGSLNPLFKPMFLDIKASANGVQLPRLTPYSAKYAGYPITKGKLSMDVQYKIENDKLVAENDVRIEQLTFGEHIDGPDATKLPVMLAVSLLKDRNGNINLNLPISGSLSDPQFSVGGIILRVFVNLIVKAVTSPFALIGSMFSGSDNIGDLHYIEFKPGSSEITPEIRKKLDALGHVLTERPGIKLDITGRVDPKIDDQGLREESLNRQMRSLKRKDLIDKEGQPSGPVQIGDAERAKYMERVYKDGKFKKPRNMIGLTKSLPPEEMQKLIVDNTEVTPDDLRNLAQRRADQVRSYLQEQSAIPPERIFLIAPKLNADGIPDKEATTRVDLGIE
ncbi:DUF748 domain-containing protein [Herbaspirillum sp.]|uniref:DUF748 domain-containing protein n=1 Tax=Herbaspirillum sp. TaxID=1890675 RepID=UPI001B223829|nr:DUF748 domain-containing protein [Herbaspirillum sp.]MBO9538096.1 DUF748 domain-containing protein [Herbaspirillum sp.]